MGVKGGIRKTLRSRWNSGPPWDMDARPLKNAPFRLPPRRDSCALILNPAEAGNIFQRSRCGIERGRAPSVVLGNDNTLKISKCADSRILLSAVLTVRCYDSRTLNRRSLLKCFPASNIPLFGAKLRRPLLAIRKPSRKIARP